MRSASSSHGYVVCADMIHLRPSVLAFTAFVFLAGEASACRFYRPPAEHLANRLARPYEAIVRATVSEVETSGDDTAPSWRATFRVDGPVKGQASNRLLTSHELGGPGVCWSAPTPAIGERWVVFLAHRDHVDGFAYPEAFLPDGILSERIAPIE